MKKIALMVFTLGLFSSYNTTYSQVEQCTADQKLQTLAACHYETCCMQEEDLRSPQHLSRAIATINHHFNSLPPYALSCAQALAHEWKQLAPRWKEVSFALFDLFEWILDTMEAENTYVRDAAMLETIRKTVTREQLVSFLDNHAVRFTEPEKALILAYYLYQPTEPTSNMIQPSISVNLTIDFNLEAEPFFMLAHAALYLARQLPTITAILEGQEIEALDASTLAASLEKLSFAFAHLNGQTIAMEGSTA
jgi:hypothetical protein